MFSPLAALVCLGGFIIIVALTRYVSLGSIVCAAFFPLAAYLFGEPMFMTGIGVILAGLIIVRHAANIQRLLSGSEKKLSFKKN
jgi:glycerol-3-phosphate acyltransferase PlsY